MKGNAFPSSLKAKTKAILTSKLTALKKKGKTKQRIHSKVQYNFKKYYQCHYSLAKSTNVLKTLKLGFQSYQQNFTPLRMI